MFSNAHIYINDGIDFIDRMYSLQPTQTNLQLSTTELHQSVIPPHQVSPTQVYMRLYMCLSSSQIRAIVQNNTLFESRKSTTLTSYR